MNNAIVSVANSEYISFFLPLVQSAKAEGKWEGDFCLIVNEKINKDIEDQLRFNNIYIFRAKLLPQNPTIHWYKMYLFDEYFKKWDWILYCDLDVLFLNRIELKLDTKDKNILYTKTDDLSFIQHFTEREDKKVDKILEKYGNGDAMQTCFLLYHNNLINLGYFQKLYDAFLYYYCQYKLYKKIYWDQTIFNIVFYKKWLDLGKEFIAIYPVVKQFNWEGQKIDNPYTDNNDYTNTIALHFFHFMAPWTRRNLTWYPIWKNYRDSILKKPKLI